MLLQFVIGSLTLLPGYLSSIAVAARIDPDKALRIGSMVRPRARMTVSIACIAVFASVVCNVAPPLPIPPAQDNAAAGRSAIPNKQQPVATNEQPADPLLASGTTGATGADVEPPPLPPVPLPCAIPDPPMVNALAAATAAGSVSLSGKISPKGVGKMVEISAPSGVFTVKPASNLTFKASVPLLNNRINPIVVSTVTSCGSRGAPRTVSITQDAEPPNLWIDFPADGAQIQSAATDVAGRVGDRLSGYQGLQVTVNGQAAAVDIGIGPNGTFFLPAVPLSNSSPTQITVIARDALGNQQSKQITVSQLAIPPNSPKMSIVSGNGQMSPIHTEVAAPIVVQVQKGDGTPFANKLVTFDVTRSDGVLASAPSLPVGMRVRMLQVFTDASGRAEGYWTLGSDAGSGNNRVEVTSKDIAGTVLFCASAQAGPAAQINIGFGNNQLAEAGSPLAGPLRAWVSDGCNGIPGVPVTFSVTQGGGKVSGQPAVTIMTGPTGHAEANLTLGPEAGENLVEADFAGNTTAPAVFSARGLVRDATQPTRFTGLVFDNASLPIGGVAIRLAINNVDVAATATNEQGQFELAGFAGSGKADLYLDGLVADTLNGLPIPPGSFPGLHYEMIVVPNADNSLPMPVLLPPLNPANARSYSTTQETVLTVEGIEGLRMFVAPGSMRFADGQPAPDGTTIALNQVHRDNVPMPVPDGGAPLFAWTLQPAGAHFDPPIRIEYPNMSAQPPGAITSFLTFDHDTGKFEVIASAHVTDDGAFVVSDPGSGLTLAGWGGGNPPPPPTGSACSCPTCTVCMPDGSCAAAGGACDDGDPCTINDQCVNGVCVGTPVQCDACSTCVMGECIPLSQGGCSDNDPCTVNDHCVNGVCVGEPKECWACEACTNGICAYSSEPECLEPCTSPPRPCHECQDGFQVPQSNVGCDDGNPYTFPDICFRGNCIGTPIKDCGVCECYVNGDCVDESPDLDIFGPDCICVGETVRFTSNGILQGAECRASGAAICDQAGFSTLFVTGSVPGETVIVAFTAKRICDDTNTCYALAFKTLRIIECGTCTGCNTPGRIDHRWTATIGTTPVPVRPDGSVVLRNIPFSDQFGSGGPGTPPDSLSDDFFRLTASAVIGGQTHYAFSDPFQITRNQSSIIPNITITDCPPPLPKSIAFDPHGAAINSIGGTLQLAVTATLNDGSMIDVTTRSQWTTYRTSNPAIATIGPDGLVTAVAAGQVFITASNDAVTAVTRVSVVPGDPLTRVVGLVQFADGLPAVGARVFISRTGAFGDTGADGRFSINGAATAFGPLNITVRAALNGRIYGAAVLGLPSMPGMITDAGILTLVEIGIDSDMDCIPDDVELATPGLNPNDSDSDNDGIMDGDEDFDGDGLTNCEETLAGTDLRSADNDGDGLDDSDELDQGSDPFNPDTDNDGFIDGEEVQWSADPRDPQSIPLAGLGDVLGGAIQVFNAAPPGALAGDTLSSMALLSNATLAGSRSGDTQQNHMTIRNATHPGARFGDVLQSAAPVGNAALPDPNEANPEFVGPPVSLANGP